MTRLRLKCVLIYFLDEIRSIFHEEEIVGDGIYGNLCRKFTSLKRGCISKLLSLYFVTEES